MLRTQCLAGTNLGLVGLSTSYAVWYTPQVASARPWFQSCSRAEWETWASLFLSHVSRRRIHSLVRADSSSHTLPAAVLTLPVRYTNRGRPVWFGLSWAELSLTGLDCIGFDRIGLAGLTKKRETWHATNR